MLAEVLTQDSNTGLADLVQQVANGVTFRPNDDWNSWFEAAMAQLETDDLIDSRFTDSMADCLFEAEDALKTGFDFRPALKRLCHLYHRNLESQPLELVWRRRAASLGAVQLSSSTWNGLQAALDDVARGPSKRVAVWLDQIEEYFLGCWETYEEGDVLESEITTESVLCHRFLQEGTELWLEAISAFREGLSLGVCRQTVLKLAEEGQRHLVLVQILHEEMENRASQVLAWAHD